MKNVCGVCHSAGQGRAGRTEFQGAPRRKQELAALLGQEVGFLSLGTEPSRTSTSFIQQQSGMPGAVKGIPPMVTRWHQGPLSCRITGGQYDYDHRCLQTGKLKASRSASPRSLSL